MNNSKIALDNQEVFTEKTFDKKPILRQREGELVKLIETIMRIEQSEDWQGVRNHIFYGLVESIEGRIRNESGKGELNQPEIYRLQRQLLLARKYADFKKLADVYRSELSNVKQQLNNNLRTEPDNAPDTNEND